MLPSEVLERATTFDLQILSIASQYEKYQREKVKNDEPEESVNYSQEDLIQMMERTKNA